VAGSVNAASLHLDGIQGTLKNNQATSNRARKENIRSLEKEIAQLKA